MDVFSDVPLAGNALAVFTDASGLSTETMRRAARELQLSETAFVCSAGVAARVGPDEGPVVASAHVRIFTPVTELPFAGHPVLGSACVIAEQARADVVHLRTADRTVPVTLTRVGGTIVSGELEHDLPQLEPFPQAAELLEALGVARSELPVEAYRNGLLHLYVSLTSESRVTALSPDQNALARLGPLGVSCFAVSGTRVKTRMFGPGVGVVEDPATGSAAGPLLVHLIRHGLIDRGQEIEIRQGEEIDRPSLLRARLRSGPDRERVIVGGPAVIVAHGQYRLQ